MLFNSYEFLFKFFPIVLLFYAVAIFKFSTAVRNLVLILSSLFFYAYANVSDLALIVASIGVNYILTFLIAKYPGQKQRLVALGIILNLSVLVWYKYINFIVSILNDSFDLNWALIETHLPLAISFFTFQQISFIVDQYRAKKPSKPDFETYSTAVLFFPHLIAGPLVEYKNLIPQLGRKMRLARWLPKIYLGILIFVLGLSKKIIVADNLNSLVELAYGPQVDLAKIGFVESFFATVAYTFQLYFDFSGYSDMAIGLGLIFGIALPFNFNSPYKATSIVDFWRRWHITLSTFLRDYLYIPLGGSRHGEAKHFRNLFLTMLIGGIWHGAGWQFVIWGAWHGGWLCFVHFLRKKVPQFMNLFKFKFINQLITFICVMIGWVFFRANNHHIALEILEKIGSFKLEYLGKEALMSVLGLKTALLTVPVAAFMAFLLPNTIAILRFYKWQIYKKQNFWILAITGFALAVLINVCLLLMSKPVTFLYYQF